MAGRSKRNAWMLALLAATVGAFLSIGLASAAEPVTVTVWGSNDYRVVGLQAAADKFNATHNDVKIEVLLDGSGPNRIVTAVAGGAAPDVIVGAHSWDPDFILNGLLVNLTPLLERDGLLAELQEDIFPGLWGAGSVWNGQIYSIPLDGQTVMLYYNDDLLQQMGVPAPVDGWTLAELEASLPKLRRLHDGVLTQHALVSNANIQTATFFLALNHSGLFDPVTLQPAGSTPAFRTALQVTEDWTRRDLLRSGGVELTANDSVTEFQEGRVAYYISGNFRLPAFEGHDVARLFTKVAPALRWSANMEPRFYGSTRTLALIRPEGGVPVSDAVWEAFKYLISTEAMTIYGSVAGLLTTRRSVIEQEQYQAYLSRSEATQIIASEIMPFSFGDGITGVPYAIAIQDIMTRLITNYLKGSIGLTELAEQFDQQSGVYLAELRSVLNSR